MNITETISDTIKTACDVAAGRAPAPTQLVQVVAARRIVSSRGLTHELWYRLAWRPGATAWEYYASERMPSGMRVAERRWTGYGHLPIGSLVAQHDRGRPIDTIFLVTGESEEVELPFRRTAEGFSIRLPDGSVVTTPDPRR